MSRNSPQGMARHMTEASRANAAARERQTERVPAANDVTAPAPLSNQALGQMLAGGTPLEPSVRAEMESRFGTDFSAVRVHDAPPAHELAQQQRAQAFAIGDHIAFNRGRYAPRLADGKHLLAHELAHVVQQRRGGTEQPHAGGGLEQAAENAASAAVSGAGQVQVAGASAVGVARQPLPEAEITLPPAPRSLSNSLAKGEKSLKEPALDHEMTLIENYLDALPHIPEREYLLSEYQALYRERLARRRNAATPWPEKGELEQEVEQAHRFWRLTGQIPPTRWGFSAVEVKLAKPMSRRERYDLMMELQGRKHPLEMDVREDQRDPEILDKDEFVQEYRSRIAAEKDACDDEYFWPKYERQCKRRVDEKYGGPAFVAWQDAQYRRAYAHFVQVSAKIDAVKYGGPVSLAGRVAGYGYGALTGKDALQTSENWATVASIGDLYRPRGNARSRQTGTQNSPSSGGLQVGRDANVTLFQPRSSAMTPKPDPVTPKFAPGGSSSRPTGQPPLFSTSGPPAPLPISSGQGLPQSDASRALKANLARQSPAQVGSITPLPVKKPQASPPATQSAQQAVPAVAAVEDKIAVGQTHGAGTTATVPAASPLQVMQGGQQPVVASLKKQPARKQAKTPVTAPARTAPVVMPGAASAKVAPGVPPVATPGSGGNAADPLVAVRVAGGGSAKKGTFFVQGTPEFDKANGDRSFTVMPRSQALALRFRPAGTAFDPTIEPFKVGGVQVESNAAGEGKGSKHNIAARADIHATEEARTAAYGKTIGAATAEGHGQKQLIDRGEIVIQRPGNASTGGVDSMTADVGRVPPGQPAPAGTTVPKVFLNDFTGPETTKGSKPTQANWVVELRDSVTNPKFGFGNAQFDNAVYEAIQNGEVYVRTVRIETSAGGTKVTIEPARKIAVPPAIKAAVTKARRARDE